MEEEMGLCKKDSMHSEAVRRLAAWAKEMGLPGCSRMGHEEAEETGPCGTVPSPETQVKNYEQFLKTMQNHYGILQQERSFSMHVPLMPSWKHWFCSLCFQNGPHFPPSLWAPQTFVRPPRTARHFAAAPAHHYQTPRPPWLEAFPHSAQILRLLGLWRHSQNIFLCNRDACLENPSCKHFSLPGGYTQLFCKILRHKRDIPS